MHSILEAMKNDYLGPFTVFNTQLFFIVTLYGLSRLLRKLNLQCMTEKGMVRASTYLCLFSGVPKCPGKLSIRNLSWCVQWAFYYEKVMFSSARGNRKFP